MKLEHNEYNEGGTRRRQQRCEGRDGGSPREGFLHGLCACHGSAMVHRWSLQTVS